MVYSCFETEWNKLLKFSSGKCSIQKYYLYSPLAVAADDDVAVAAAALVAAATLDPVASVAGAATLDAAAEKTKGPVLSSDFEYSIVFL